MRRVIDVSHSIDIDRPGGEVFDFVSEFPNNPRWQRGQRSCEWTSEPPLRVGSTYDQHARFLGRDMTNSFRVLNTIPAGGSSSRARAAASRSRSRDPSSPSTARAAASPSTSRASPAASSASPSRSCDGSSGDRPGATSRVSRRCSRAAPSAPRTAEPGMGERRGRDSNPRWRFPPILA